MSKHALRPGELVIAHQSVEKRGALMFASPEERFNGSAMGHFTFGMYLASARRPEPMTGNTTTFLLLLDSPTCRVGWCLAKLIRRAP
jgi:hypothetical protein